MHKKFVAGIACIIIVVISLLSAACDTDNESTPPVVEAEPWPIPEDFKTYTKEGLFSISYPQDWAPAQSMMEELWEEIQEAWESLYSDADLIDGNVVFFAGVPYLDGYYPGMNILVSPCDSGHRTLNEVIEGSDLFERENPTPGFRQNSRTDTLIDGRRAIITDSRNDKPGRGPWRHLQMITVEGEYVWTLTCSSVEGDYSKFEGDFYNIVRSFKVLE